MLRLHSDLWPEIVARALRALPEEACGLLAGRYAGEAADAVVFHPCRNAASSARVYTLDPGDHLRADREAEDRGMELVGVVHSHTHTEAWPSPTDVSQAPDPAWHYVIVSLRRAEPVLRSFRIVDGRVTEEPVQLASPS